MKLAIDELHESYEYKTVLLELTNFRSFRAIEAFNKLCEELAELRAKNENPDSER